MGGEAGLSATSYNLGRTGKRRGIEPPWPAQSHWVSSLKGARNMGRSQLRFLALVGAVLMVVAACGSTSSGPAAKQVKVGLVTDVGGLNDKSFNHLAYVGLQKAIADFHVKGDVTESKTGDDYVPNLTSYASKNYDLVIGVGFPCRKRSARCRVVSRTSTSRSS